MPTDARRPAEAEAGRERLGRKAADGNHRRESTPAENGKSGGQIHVDALKKRGEEKYREPGRGHSAASRRGICLPIRLSCHRAGQASAGHGAGIQRHTPSTSVPGVGGPPGRRATARQKLAAVRGTPPAVGGTPGMDPGSQSEAKAPRVTQATARRMENATPKRIAAPRQEETKHERRIHWRRPWTQPHVRRRNRMRAGTTQLRGTSREGHTANRRRGWIGKLRSTTTQRAEGTARLITTIAMIVALIGGARPAAAQVPGDQP